MIEINLINKNLFLLLFPKFVDYFVAEREKRGIYNNVICPSNNKLNRDSFSSLRSVKKIDKERFPFTCDIKICWDFVNIITFKKDKSIWIAIRDKEIARNFRVLFRHTWENLD